MNIIDRKWSSAILANSIKNLRIHRGLTQQGLADRMNVTQSIVSRWEDPEYQGWSFRTLIKIGFGLNGRLRIKFISKDKK